MGEPSLQAARAALEHPRLRLASASPRRRLLLPLLGYPVQVSPTDVDERPLPGEPALEMARRLAAAKASAAELAGPGEVVVGADSIVVLEGVPLGKPVNESDARGMLEALRGRRHEVITGVALLAIEGSELWAVRTAVAMREYGDDEIERYIASGRPRDKAGAYAIQDTDFGPVQRIEGCFLNVVGLPLCEVSRGLARLGWGKLEERYEPPCCWCRRGQTVLDDPTSH